MTISHSSNAAIYRCYLHVVIALLFKELDQLEKEHAKKINTHNTYAMGQIMGYYDLKEGFKP